ncbi:MAG: class I SAM-dependent methyltransferase [bacterium]|nr:class I SAM-dependent methyltransferase [bacterium]
MNPPQKRQSGIPDLDFSGERIVPGKVTLDRELASRLRYEFAARYVEGKRVLDIGCGEGYGSAMLAQHAAHVVGTDSSEKVVAHATAKYGLSNIEFRCMPAEKHAFPDESFDVVVCLELIEHVHDYAAVMEEMHRLLKPGGILILSTPNKDVTSPGRETPIHDFHVHEFTIRELQELCQRYFAEVELFSQENPFEKSRRIVRWLMALDFLHVRKLLPRRSKDRMKEGMKEKMGETIQEEPESGRWAVIRGAKPNCRDIVLVCRKAT